MASVFEEDILHSGALGLERKVRLARAIAKDWLYDEEGDPADYARAIAAAKSHGDQVAHWPTRLQPLEDSDGNVVNYAVFIEKGAASTELTSDIRNAWFAGIEDASSRTQAIINRIKKHIKSGLE